MKKQCSACKEVLLAGQFYKDKKGRISSRCRKCTISKYKEWYSSPENRQRVKIRKESDEHKKRVSELNKRECKKREKSARRTREDQRLKANEARDKRNAIFPQKDRAQKKSYYAIKSGKITRPDKCSSCGIKCKPHAHHCDYTKPLDVIFLCPQCHSDWHKHNTPIIQ